ncbi:SDR family oxidoreductase [Pseudomonas oryzihabitans]|uniref:NADP-dependent 3-hydroxy acid dehydrogenase YdfG n=1 Tax=Pseudomonas oryzihabitans TaxID=47885 RepID=A0AAJ2BK81_9PSED|nr:SDR family oxidoreductase [Pseudomonas psychrotolerans]MDR6233920.1 NADP-dependent 3-hydroxy acid dehydrogenase YdfG [Pseudomonas psychrotolerans]MDR6356998.1 NADP-dependent 3-hydroxy acid dehydrogenase YdfG [Pseudomonas psychrotolerans]MDR6680605.1 NADP-dependent 3-hydroxy acid dehydrogenase YdfG [Pseudomonas psychrotolerans]
MSSIFITGATSGFGAATARRFAKDGWSIVITGRREDRLHALAEELSGQAKVLPLVLDVQDRAAVEAAVAALPEEFNQLRALVNNAGLALGTTAAQDCDLDDWDTMVDTNIKGMLYCTRLLLPRLIAHGAGAGIVNLGSVAGDYPYPGSHVYGATKAFLKQFSLSLRSDLLGTGVRVTNIEPGLSESEFSVVRFGGDQAKADAVYAGTEPLTPDDIAESIHWTLNQPKHVNINRIQLMATCQAFSNFNIHRKS